MEHQPDPFDISRRYTTDVFALSPIAATTYGIDGSDHLWDDFSPDGVEARREMRLGHRHALEPFLDDPDPDTRHAAVVLAGDLDIDLAVHESGDYLRDLGHAFCSFTQVRDVFDIAPRADSADWDNIATRLETIGQPLTGWTRLLAEGVVRGEVVARRQVESLIEQAANLAGPQSMFGGLVLDADATGNATPRLTAAAETARRAAAATADWLRTEYLPHAPDEDGVGEERYVRAAERFLGMILDPSDTYAWGWDEIERLRQEMAVVAAEIDPDLSLDEVFDLLETDPVRAVPVSEFTRFVQERLDQAVADLDGRHFQVPEPVRRVTVSLAPPGGSLGAWYVNPSADWERPGSVWYSLGERTSIPLWQEVSTAYHEGFPGHHLQVGTAMAQADHLSEAHRLLIWYSGYGEGWALYTERLMDELGYFEKPEYRLGMLASQLFRAVRVVVDIGSHLGYPIPPGAPLYPGEEWNFDRAVSYMTGIAIQPPDISVSEVTRYLGWPGQAISYKVGEREILDLRRILSARPGFDLKEFHRRLLEGGELRLDYLRQRMLG